MRTNLHKAWDASLLVCELLGVNSIRVADGRRPFISEEREKLKNLAMDVALMLRQEVLEEERDKYWLATHPNVD